MIRRIMCMSLVVAVGGLVCGCDKPPVSTNPDSPIKTSDGVDKKGKKSRAIEASFEETPKK
jgi:hypothetical protein